MTTTVPHKNPSSFQQLLTLLTLALLLTGCAASVTYMPSNLTSDTEATRPRHITVDRQTNIRLDTGYTRTLRAGSEWQLAGRIAQGDVYQPQNDVFTLEGKHIHEAWLVIADSRLAGFYLPVEHGFSPIVHSVDLSFSSTRK